MQTSKQNILHSGKKCYQLRHVVLEYTLLLAIYHLIFAKSNKYQGISSGQQSQRAIRGIFT